MTNKEINKFLSDSLFGWKCGIDYDYPINHNLSWYSAEELGDEEGGYICSHCKELFAKSEAENETCYKYPPYNFFLNYQQVLEKLEPLENHNEIHWTIQKYDDGYSASISYSYDGEIIGGCKSVTESYVKSDGYTLGEAICRAANNYLKGAKYE